jgi:hypothetical protein
LSHEKGPAHGKNQEQRHSSPRFPAQRSRRSGGARRSAQCSCKTAGGETGLGPPQIPLSAFVSYLREPSGQMPPSTAKAVSNEDLAEIYNFLKSVPPPPPLKTIPILNQ